MATKTKSKSKSKSKSSSAANLGNLDELAKLSAKYTRSTAIIAMQWLVLPMLLGILAYTGSLLEENIFRSAIWWLIPVTAIALLANFVVRAGEGKPKRKKQRGIAKFVADTRYVWENKATTPVIQKDNVIVAGVFLATLVFIFLILVPLDLVRPMFWWASIAGNTTLGLSGFLGGGLPATVAGLSVFIVPVLAYGYLWASIAQIGTVKRVAKKKFVTKRVSWRHYTVATAVPILLVFPAGMSVVNRLGF